MNLNQLFFMRPVPGWADHRTPVRGLSCASPASTRAGGEVGSLPAATPARGDLCANRVSRAVRNLLKGSE